MVYIDDIIVGSSSKRLNDQFKTNLSSHFKMKDLGPFHFFLGLKIARSVKGIVVSERKFILEMLEEYGILGVKPCSIPMEVN